MSLTLRRTRANGDSRYRRGELIDVCLEFLRQDIRNRSSGVRDLEQLDPKNQRRMKDFLKRVRIETNERKKFRIEGIEMNAGSIRFSRRNPDGSEDVSTTRFFIVMQYELATGDDCGRVFQTD